MALKRILLAALCLLSLVTAAAGNVFALPSSDETGKQAVFLSPLEEWMRTWNIETYVTLLERAGYHVDVLLNEQVSVSFLKTGLTKYDVIILRTDMFSEERERGATYFCSGEPVTYEAATTFASEIASKELIVDVCVGFTSKFIEHNYPANSLKPGLVYVLASNGAQLSSAFLAAGSSVVVSFEEDFTLRFGRMDAFSQAFFKYLSRGNTVEESYKLLQTYLKFGHGNVATWPSLEWAGDANYKI